MKPSELIAEPAKWTQGVYARQVNGLDAMPNDKNAASWCIVGALIKCTKSRFEQGVGMQKLISYLSRHGHFKIDDWNDAPERTHAEVLEALKSCGL